MCMLVLDFYNLHISFFAIPFSELKFARFYAISVRELGVRLMAHICDFKTRCSDFFLVFSIRFVAYLKEREFFGF